MAGISLGGVNLDVSGIVSQLMSIDSRPLFKLQDEITDYNSQLSEVGRLKGVLSSFQSSMEQLSSLDKFETYKASNSEDSADKSFTTTLDKEAVAGIYSINVTALATVDKWGQDPLDANANFNSSDDLVATETLKFSVGVGDDKSDFEIDINGKNISEVRDAINAAAEGKSPGLSASLIQTGTDKFQLVMTSTDTGEDNAIVFDQTRDAFSALKLTNTQVANDASVEIDGYTVTSSTNTIEGALDGVTLSLLQENPSASAAQLEISRDTAALKTSINSFVSNFNSLISSIEIYKTGALEGDSTLNSIVNSMRGELNSSADSGGIYNYLAEIGVKTNEEGELELDSDTLDKAVENNYEDISKLFAAEDKGIAFRLSEKVEEYLSFDGLIKNKENAINTRIRNNEDAQLLWNYRLDKKEEAYRKKFSALDMLIGEMNSTSSALTGQLAALPGFTRN